MKKLICFLPAVIIMCAIFFFSSQEAVQSTETSTGIGRGLILLKCRLLSQEISEAELEEEAIAADHFIRKTAHATEFMLLSVSLCLPIAFLLISKLINAIGTGTLIGIIYAISDELHQLFVKGRSCQISDILIDSIGVVIGAIFVYLAIHFWKEKRWEPSKKQI